MKRSKKTTAEKIYDLVRAMPEEKQAQILDRISHDCPHSHMPNENTIKAIKEKKYISQSSNGNKIIREILEN